MAQKYLYLCIAIRKTASSRSERTDILPNGWCYMYNNILPPFQGRTEERPPIIKQVPPESVCGKTLFVGTDGRFFNAAGKELKFDFSPASQRHRPNMHSAYPQMRRYANRLCHHLVWETFVGPRTPGMEIDHINGDKMNWRLDNLQEVTPAENRKRAVLLRALRKGGRDPKSMTREQLLSIFNHYEVSDPNELMRYEAEHPWEFDN